MQETAALVCGKAWDCMSTYPEDGFPFSILFGTSEAGCVSNFTSNAAQIEASVDAGRIEYDEMAATACLDATRAALDGLSCDEFWGDASEEPTACEAVFVGTVAQGDFCTMDDDCISDNCDDAAAEPTCVPTF